MSALGQKQPLTSLAAQWLLSANSGHTQTTVQPEDLVINNAHENAFYQSYMLGGNWRGPRRLEGLARCVRYPN